MSPLRVFPQSLPRTSPEHELAYQVGAFLSAKGRQNPQTARFYDCKLKHFSAWLESQGIADVIAVTPQVVRDFLAFLQDGHSQGGLHAYYRSVKHFLRWCRLEYDLSEWEPLKNVQAPRALYRPLPTATVGVVKALLKTCRGTRFVDRRDEAMLRGLCDTACRIGEYLALRLQDVHLDDGTVILRAEITKGKRERLTYLGSRALRALREYLRMRDSLRPDSPLWVTEDGRPMSYNAFHQVLLSRSHRAKVPTLSPHSLRKLAATSMYRDGANLEEIRRLLGHSTLLVTQRYIGLTDDDLRQSHRTHAIGDRLLG